MNTYTDTSNNIVYKVGEGLKKNQVSAISERFKKTKTWWQEKDQPKYTLKSQRCPTKTNTRLTELQQDKDTNGWQSAMWKEKIPVVPEKDSGGLRFHVWWTQRRDFLLRSRDVSSDQLGAMHAKLILLQYICWYTVQPHLYVLSGLWQSGVL